MVHRATDAVGRQRPFESRKEIHKKRRSREREASQQDKARNSVPMWNNEEKCKLQRSATPQSSLGAADRSIALTFPRVPAALCISYPIFCPPPPCCALGRTGRSSFSSPLSRLPVTLPLACHIANRTFHVGQLKRLAAVAFVFASRCLVPDFLLLSQTVEIITSPNPIVTRDSHPSSTARDSLLSPLFSPSCRPASHSPL